MRNYMVEVTLLPKPGLADPVAAMLMRELPRALPDIFGAMKSVRVGQKVWLIIRTEDIKAARAQAKAMFSPNNWPVGNPILQEVTRIHVRRYGRK